MPAEIAVFPLSQAKRKLRRALSRDAEELPEEAAHLDMSAAAGFLARTFAHHPELFSLAEGAVPETMPDLEHILQVRAAVDAYVQSPSSEQDSSMNALLVAVCALTTMHRLVNVIDSDDQGAHFITPSGQRDLEALAAFMDADPTHFPAPPEGSWARIVRGPIEGFAAHGALFKHALDETREGICTSFLQSPARATPPADGLPDLSGMRSTLARTLSTHSFGFTASPSTSPT